MPARAAAERDQEHSQERFVKARQAGAAHTCSRAIWTRTKTGPYSAEFPGIGFHHRGSRLQVERDRRQSASKLPSPARSSVSATFLLHALLATDAGWSNASVQRGKSLVKPQLFTTGVVMHDLDKRNDKELRGTLEKLIVK
jgi:hypothetical protein